MITLAPTHPNTTFANIPLELRRLKQWVIWQRVGCDGSFTKLPLSAITRKPASVANPETWATFDEAVSAYIAGGVDGIGFVFSENDPYFGIDIDDEAKVAPELRDRRQQIVTQIIENTTSYAEVSPSGKGTHIIAKGKLLTRGRKDSRLQIEIYSADRYFTVTGNILDDRREIVDQQEAADQLLDAMPQRRGGTAGGLDDMPLFRRMDLDDIEVLHQAKQRHPDFAARFSANTGCNPGEWSATFMAVVGAIDEVTGSVEQVRRIVFNSPMVLSAPSSAGNEARLRKAKRTLDATLAAVRDGNTARLYHVDFGRRIWARIKAEAARNSQIHATPYIWRDPITIPPRQWLYGSHLIRKQVSIVVAPGGVGKSSLLIAEALAMVTGRELLGQTVKKELRVWSWNLEDPRDELERRIQAACSHHGVNSEDLADRLFIDTGREQELCIAVTDRNGSKIQEPVVEAVVSEMLIRRIDVLIVDPFISSHRVSENDNTAMDAVAKQWGKVADRTNAAVVLVHHTRKQNGEEVTSESGRGAKALIDAARDVRALNRMTTDEAKKAGIEAQMRGYYFRSFSDKANLAPPAAASDWYKVESVSLPNGDSVGVVSKWEWPDKMDTTLEVGLEDVRKVQDLVGSERGYRSDFRSRDAWVGNLIADALGLDPETDRQAIIALTKRWVEAGWFVKERRPDAQRKPREFILLGKRAE